MTVSAYDDDDDFVTVFSCNLFVGSNYGNPPFGFSGPGDDVTSLDIGEGTEVAWHINAVLHIAAYFWHH